MENIKSIMVIALVMIIGTPSSLFCKSKQLVTFNNNLGVSVILKGPRGSKTIKNNGSVTIPPKTNPVEYSIQAEGYPQYTDKAYAGKTYTITTDDDQTITVN
jgi:hypothetical protein